MLNTVFTEMTSEQRFENEDTDSRSSRHRGRGRREQGWNLLESASRLTAGAESTGERGSNEEVGAAAGRSGGYRSPLQVHRLLLWVRREPPWGCKQRSDMTLLAKGRADCWSRTGCRRRESQRV